MAKISLMSIVALVFIFSVITMTNVVAGQKKCMFQSKDGNCTIGACRQFCSTQYHGIGNCIGNISQLQCLCVYNCPLKN